MSAIPDAQDCPFCGGDDLELVKVGPMRHVVCHDCMTSGPLAASCEDAISRWNSISLVGGGCDVDDLDDIADDIESALHDLKGLIYICRKEKKGA